MVVRFKLQEPKLRGFSPSSPFSVNSDGHQIHEILRLLVGTINVHDKFLDRDIVLNADYSRKIVPKRSAKPEKIVELLYQPDEQITLEDYANFLTKTAGSNKEFFGRIRQELVHLLVCQKSDSHAEAFLHLYRILEHISLAFPVLYSKYQSDFAASHAFHKSLFKGERDSDFVALKVFTSVLAQSANVGGLPFCFDYSVFEKRYADACIRELKSRLSSEYQELIDDTTYQLTVPFASVPGLIIEVRNKTFHFMNEDNNFRICETGGAHFLFSPITNEALYWFFHMFSEMIRALSRDHMSYAR